MESIVSTHSLCEGVAHGRRIQAPRTEENCTYDTQSSSSASLCTWLDLCTYLQQESLVFNNGVLGSKVFVAGKLHRNNGPELRQREDTHTHIHFLRSTSHRGMLQILFIHSSIHHTDSHAKLRAISTTIIRLSVSTHANVFASCP